MITMPDPSILQTADITCKILDELRTSRAGVSELATELDHAKSTIHDHLRTLEHNHLVVQDGDRYRLSIRFFDFANQVRNQFGYYEIVRDDLESISEEIGENVHFGIEEHGRVCYFLKVEGEQGVKTISSIGTSQPMHSTSLGKAILAHMEEERVVTILDRHGMPARTENTITDRKTLFDELERTRERGYSIDDEENIQGLSCIGAPVKDGDDILGAVSLSGPCSRFTEERLTNELPTLVKHAANIIELNSKFG